MSSRFFFVNKKTIFKKSVDIYIKIYIISIATMREPIIGAKEDSLPPPRRKNKKKCMTKMRPKNKGDPESLDQS